MHTAACTYLHNLSVLLVLLDVSVAIVSLLDGLEHTLEVQIVVQALQVNVGVT